MYKIKFYVLKHYDIYPLYYVSKFISFIKIIGNKICDDNERNLKYYIYGTQNY